MNVTGRVLHVGFTVSRIFKGVFWGEREGELGLEEGVRCLGRQGVAQ